MLLDAANRWQCCEAVPLHIGRKHFRITATDEFFELAFKNGEHGTEKRGSSVTATCATPGDRVVIAIPQDAFSDIQWSTDASRTSAFELKVKMLRNSGVQVEIVEAKPSVQPYESEIDPFLDDTSPQDTLLAFLAADVRREKRLNSTAAHLFQVGSTILDEISNLTEVDAMRPSSQLSGNVTTKLVLDRVQLSGFCSFKGATAYELSGKGLVLIRGANLDGGYDR